MGDKKARKKKLKKELAALNIDVSGKSLRELEELNALEKKKNSFPKTANIIPLRVSEKPIANTQIYAQGLLFSFADYKKKLCELKDFKADDLDELIGELQDASKDKNKKCTLVADDNEYKKLYSNIPNFSKVYEFVLKGDKRVFFYKIETILYVICIKHKHFSTVDRG